MTDLRPRPFPEIPAQAAPVAGADGEPRRSAATVALLVLVGVLLLGPGPAGASPMRPAQDGTTETTVEGDTPATSEPGVSTTIAGTTADGLDPVVGEEGTTTPEAEEGSTGSRRIADENRKIWVVVAGLVAVAVCLTLLTIRYWHQTRPSRVVAAAQPTVARRARKEPDAVAPGRHSRRAVAGADHAGADEAWEPRGTGEHDRVVVPTIERRPRPDRSQRAAAYAARRPR